MIRTRLCVGNEVINLTTETIKIDEPSGPIDPQGTAQHGKRKSTGGSQIRDTLLHFSFNEILIKILSDEDDAVQSTGLVILSSTPEG